MNRNGICSYCQQELNKRDMGEHLKECKARKTAFSQGGAKEIQEYYQIMVEDTQSDKYWMYVLVRSDATLELLDDFLRGIWVGDQRQPSIISIGAVDFLSDYEESKGASDVALIQSMKHPLCDLLWSNQTIEFDCCFDDLDEFALTMCENLWELPFTDSIMVMARNCPPDENLPNTPRGGEENYTSVKGFDISALRVQDYQLSEDRFSGELLLEDGVDEDYWLADEDEYEDPDLEDLEAELEAAGEYVFTQILKADKPLLSNSMAELLNRYDKEFLKDICRGNNITKYSKLRKSELIDTVVRELTEQYKGKLFALDSEQLGVLKRISKAGGTMYAEKLFAENKSLQVLWRSHELLLLFFGTKTVEGEELLVACLPNELLAVVQQADWKILQKNARRNELWMRLVKGMLYYYGVLEYPLVFFELERICGRELPKDEFLPVFFAHSTWYLELGIWGGHLHDIAITNPEDLLVDIENSRKQRPGLEYKVLTRQQMLKAANAEHIETKAYRVMKRYLLSAYDMDAEDADMEIWDILDRLDEGQMIGSQMDELVLQFGLEDPAELAEFMQYASELYNQHRQWVLLGNSPGELHKSNLGVKHAAFNVLADPATPQKKATVYDFNTKKKVGRNDPCPCGSGKKFKKCCGR